MQHADLIYQLQGFFGHSVQYSIINELLFLHRPSIYQTKNSFPLMANMDIDSEDVSVGRLFSRMNRF